MSEIDPRKVSLNEKDIEDWLYENPNAVKTEFGVEVVEWVARQFQVPSGVIDLLGVDEEHGAVVVEVKNTEIKAEALTQVCRYAQDIRSVLIRLKIDYVIPSKIVVGKGDVSNKIMNEADALNVSLQSFDVDLNLKLSGNWGWTADYMTRRREEIGALTKLAVFNDFIVKQDSDIVEQAKEIIDESTEG